MSQRRTVVAMCVLVALAAGCAPTRQAKRVEQSGFLGDYSKLEPGKGNEALLVYRNPKADFTKYDKILVEAVTVWRPRDAESDDVSADEMQALADYLHAAMVTKLDEDYQIVTASGPGVLRVRLAITEATGANATMNTVTTIIPQTRTLSALRHLATGTRAFVGRASAEAEILDGQSGERLFAAADRREGGKTLQTTFSTWGDVKAAYDHWAERARDRLREERQKAQTPPKPSKIP